MLTQQQYDKANAHRAVVKFIAEGGGGHRIPQELYDISEEMGLGKVDLTCNGCKIQWMKDLWEMMKAYEASTNKP